jgi:FkbH-like protein
MQVDPLAQYRSLRKEGRLADATALARRAVPSLEANHVAQLGKLLFKDLPSAFPEGPALEVLLLGQCTTNYLPALVTAWAWAEGLRVGIREGEYDQVVQELMRQEQAPDVVVLLPWNQRLLAQDSRTAEERIEDEMVFLQQSWAQVARLKSKLVQVSYDWTGAGALGYAMSSRRGGDISLVRQANASLHAALPPGAFFVDLEHVSAWHGKSRFYDERNYHWLKQPFSPEGLSVLAHKMAVGLRVLTTGRKKVLVLDLDNTLWGGVVGELGAHGIAIGGSTEGEAFLAFQKHVKRLKETGIILAACSKNNDADAREPFEKNEMMVLRLNDFAAFHASWDTKPARLRQIAQELNLGLDSFVFFDDNPAEREHVRAELPEVIVPEVPAEPALYIRTLLETLAFEAVDITSADAGRSGQYAAEASRKRIQSEAATPEQYLSSLEMRAEVQPVDPSNMDRVVDLITKTNQFNLTTRRHSRTAVEEMAASPRNVCFAVKLADKFGDYGLIAAVLAVAEDQTTLRLDTWLMSCRAMGRTVEHFTLNYLVKAARRLEYARLIGEYRPTAKNVPVKTLLPDFGFVPEQGSEARWALNVGTFVDMPSQVTN